MLAIETQGKSILRKSLVANLLITLAAILTSCAPSLQQAISASNANKVREILSNKPDDVNKNIEWQFTSPSGERLLVSTCPLIVAIYEGEKQIVDLLLDSGANPNGPDYYMASTTPLYAATFEAGLFRFSSGFYDKGIIRSLLDHGAAVDKPIRGTILFITDKGINDPIFFSLRRMGIYINVGGYFIEGATPLHMAALHGSEDDALLYIERGADVNTRNALGWTVLHSAIRGSLDLTVVKLLVERGADVNAKDDAGDTPLIEVAKRGYLEVAEVLMNERVDINAVNGEGRTALDYAIEGHHEDIVALLVRHQKDMKE